MVNRNTLKKILATIFSFVILFANLNLIASADTTTMQGLNTTANCGFDKSKCSGSGDAGAPSDAVMKDIPSSLGRIIGTALSFVGIIFFILMIYGGFSWMLARGDSNNVQKAKELIEAAVVGLIIVLSAYAITEWLGTQLTSK